jgi:hypothetical protein
VADLDQHEVVEVLLTALDETPLELGCARLEIRRVEVQIVNIFQFFIFSQQNHFIVVTRVGVPRLDQLCYIVAININVSLLRK